MSKQEEIQKLIDKFHRKVEKDENLRNELMPIKKTFNIDLGEEKYSIRLENAALSDFRSELTDGADVTLTTTPESFQGLIDGTLRPMKAYVTKKISVKGKIDDLMFLKKLF